MSSSNLNETVVLKPNPRLPIIIAALGLSLLVTPIWSWLPILIIIFALFLLIQSFTLKLEFTHEALVVKQLGKELRRFPFKDWIAWRLFLPELPGLLYFREEASPHLLPILFDKEELKKQLRLRVGSMELPQETSDQST